MRPPDEMRTSERDMDLHALHDQVTSRKYLPVCTSRITITIQLLVIASAIMRANKSLEGGAGAYGTMERLASLERRVADLEAAASMKNAIIQELQGENAKFHRAARHAGRLRESTQSLSGDSTEIEDGDPVLEELKRFSASAANAIHQHTPYSGESVSGTSPKPEDDHLTPRPVKRGISIDSEQTLYDLQAEVGESTSVVSAERTLEINKMKHPSEPASISTHTTNTTQGGRGSAVPAWYLEYSSPPATALVLLGRFTLDYVEGHLALDKKTTSDIESLQKAPGLGLRVLVDLNVAFIFDPVILEGPDKSYLIDWATPEENLDTTKYLTGGTSKPAARHIFSFQSERDGWYYLGLHILTPVQLDSVWDWHKLSKKGVRTLAAELQKRWASDTRRSDIAAMLEKGDIEQCCFELSSTGLEEKTRAFIADTGLGNPEDVGQL
ncbi:hypothetical protein OBBRIDRAFT_751832 [Obba rivulosa]|uniref:Uncharacterized protein n=1 Tax=Obba rivulosa TaxID=1052685 RepID=A0A8E2B1D4_9APHY|nr:hypothetical protein OBBRIDRAFT_751832 [Obba rivulosa]